MMGVDPDRTFAFETPEQLRVKRVFRQLAYEHAYREFPDFDVFCALCRAHSRSLELACSPEVTNDRRE